MKQRIGFALTAVLACGLLGMAMSCGGGGSSSSDRSGGGGTGVATGTNTTPIAINGGISSQFSYPNGIFVSVTVCRPGTSACTTVSNVLLDTGSVGLRLLSNTVSGIGLTNEASGSATLANCVQYLDNDYQWGPVAVADVKMGGEVASSVPIQIVSQTGDGFAAAPTGCAGSGANAGSPVNTADLLGANGILGVWFLQQDCGPACAPGSTDNPGIYFACDTTGSCPVTTVAVAQQVSNPVAFFAGDNNGVVLNLANIPATGAVSSTGTLIFGIGTQSNNALGSAKVLTPDDEGNFTTRFNGYTTPVGFIDSGSNALYFLQGSLSGVTECSGSTYAGWYCPGSTENLTATNTGSNGVSVVTSFSVANAETLLNPNSSNVVFSNLAGTGDDTEPNNSFNEYFDWGLPFFFGRNVYLAMDRLDAGGTTGPYYAY